MNFDVLLGKTLTSVTGGGLLKMWLTLAGAFAIIILVGIGLTALDDVITNNARKEQNNDRRCIGS